ncbi:MAG: hypothetical protein IKB45_03380 [Clostridia bacterium]|nr:hypothetical protein [Clostridia bacterium]
MDKREKEIKSSLSAKNRKAFDFINPSAKPTHYLFTITSYFLLAHPLKDEHRVAEVYGICDAVNNE